MEQLNTIVAILGSLVLVLTLSSRRLEKSPLPPTVLALLLGIALGPQALGVIDLSSSGEEAKIIEALTRLALGIGLVGVALRVPRTFHRPHLREITVLITLGMLMMWAISSALVYLILGLPPALAALIGAILTATDPVAASPIVTGELAEKNIPEPLRHLISTESGANDGLGYLFVFLPFLLITRPAGEALSHWFSRTLLYEVGVATLAGLLLGYLAGKLLQAAERRQLVSADWQLVYTVALALAAVGLGRLIASDEVLLVFASGVAFVQAVGDKDRTTEERGQEAVNRFFAVPIFVVLGLTIPWEGWFALGWKGPALAVAILALRRPPVLLALRPLLPTAGSRAETLFTGWFGPIAVAAMYYASLMESRLGDAVIWHAVSLVVVASVIAHGVTASWMTRALGRRGAS